MQGRTGFEELIGLWRAGDAAARDTLIARLHPELSAIAAAQLRRERGTSLSSGDLVNDAVIRLVRLGHVELVDRSHVIALAARLMRNILVDHARAKATDKRQHQKIELRPEIDGEQRIDLIELETALVRLGAVDPALAELVEMRCYGGMAVPDIAAVTGQSEATIKRRWRSARAWLVDALGNRIDG